MPILVAEERRSGDVPRDGWPVALCTIKAQRHQTCPVFVLVLGITLPLRPQASGLIRHNVQVGETYLELVQLRCLRPWECQVGYDALYGLRNGRSPSIVSRLGTAALAI
jgi:hypothetical protein